jgi:hypothetical protein
MTKDGEFTEAEQRLWDKFISKFYKLMWSFIVLAVTYVGYAIWFAASLNTRVGNLESGKSASQVYINRLSDAEVDIKGLQVEVVGMKAAVNRIDSNIQRIVDRLYDNK